MTHRYGTGIYENLDTYESIGIQVFCIFLRKSRHTMMCVNRFGKEEKRMDDHEKKRQSRETAENEEIRDYGQVLMAKGKQGHQIHLISIIGEVEGHECLNENTKTTKYEHILPRLAALEDDSRIDGILVLLNTVGGDVEAGLAIAEMIASLSKPVVSLVLGGSHSIGVPLATAGDYSYIAPSATMIVHPIRTNGLVIGINESFQYFKKMQERIDEFITRTSNIERDKLSELMHAKDELITDVGSVLIGKEAVECGLIDEVGGLKEALAKLKELIKEDKKNEGNK